MKFFDNSITVISVSIRCFLQNLEKIKVKVFILFFREREAKGK
ncbi:hypothetical protein LEP1GSC071_3538 [Leptospira santarosai str. JET]|nr:hypothetical protein LEP1GSC071_3538 [Leptospira santarosai str. JET]